MEVEFKEIGQVNDEELKFAVIYASFKDKWVFVKHKQRDTWEIPGGHREIGEDIFYTAKRELFEETGAIDFNITPVCEYLCDYSENDKSYGRLFYAEIEKLCELPNFEIGTVKLFNTLPDKLTYSEIQPYLHEKIMERINYVRDKKVKNIAVLVYDNVELMDFCGPYDVFSIANKMEDGENFNIFTVAETKGPVMTQNGLSVNSDYSINECHDIDILIIPGGQGSRKEMNNEKLLDWIKSSYPTLEMVLSVCTGALLLGKCGLLEGLTATTHHNAIGLLRKVCPNSKIVKDKRYVDNGKIVLSAGVSSGIDMSLYVLEKLLGQELVSKVKENMEYDWMA